MYRFLPSDNVLNVSLRFGFSSREPYFSNTQKGRVTNDLRSWPNLLNCTSIFGYSCCCGCVRVSLKVPLNIFYLLIMPHHLTPFLSIFSDVLMLEPFLFFRLEIFILQIFIICSMERMNIF